MEFKKKLQQNATEGQIADIETHFIGAEQKKRIKKVTQEFRHRYEESVTVRNQALKAYRKAKFYLPEKVPLIDLPLVRGWCSPRPHLGSRSEYQGKDTHQTLSLCSPLRHHPPQKNTL